MSSLRLKIICDLVDYNSIVADIGTDHGIIPIELSKKSISKKIIANDISKNFLEKLENKKCSIVICAQTIGEGKEEIQKTIDKYSEKEIVSISKTKGYKKIAQEINDKVTEILDCLEKLSKNL